MTTYILGYDTETTGFPSSKKPLNDETQPHVVQLAAQLVELSTKQVVQSMDVIIRPDGWTIPKESEDVHGISTEKAFRLGVREDVAIEMFYDLWLKANFRVGHNEQFDAKIISIGLSRFMPLSSAEKWNAGHSFCTQRESTNIVNIPPTQKMLAVGRKTPKSPNLAEAYKFFSREELVGAHNALVDVQACMSVYWGIRAHRDAA